jgi:hypothetical protein
MTMTSASANPYAFATTEPAEIRLQATFWRSPFAVAAATVVVSQFLLIAMTLQRGGEPPIDTLSSLTLLAATMLVAGIWPAWNYIAIGTHGIEQQAGLTRLFVSWDQVRAVDADSYGVRLQYHVEGDADAAPRQVRFFNRYAVDGAQFADLIESGWRQSRQNRQA